MKAASKVATAAAIDAAVLLLVPRARGIVREALVIRLDAIGDFILASDGLAALCRHYASNGLRTTLVANCAWSDLARELGFADVVLPVDRRALIWNPAYRFALMARLRRRGAGVAVSPATSREFLHADSIVRLSGAVERIGSAGDLANCRAWQKRLSDRWYTRLLPANPAVTHEIDRSRGFLSGLGLEAPIQGTEWRRLARRSPLPEPWPAPYYVLALGAGLAGKTWPIDRFVEIARRMHVATGWTVMLVGAPREQPLARAFVRGVDFPVDDRVGHTSVRELVSLIAAAKFVVGNDSGPIHVAAHCGVPSAAVVGGGHFSRFLPYPDDLPASLRAPRVAFHAMSCYGCIWRCIYDVPASLPRPCIEAVATESLWAVIQNELAPTHPSMAR